MAEPVPCQITPQEHDDLLDLAEGMSPMDATGVRLCASRFRRQDGRLPP